MKLKKVFLFAMCVVMVLALTACSNDGGILLELLSYGRTAISVLNGIMFTSVLFSLQFIAYKFRSDRE
ncbi:MAG: hypothetical protein ACLTKI_06210 [Lachnospiraceae bacterium]